MTCVARLLERRMMLNVTLDSGTVIRFDAGGLDVACAMPKCRHPAILQVDWCFSLPGDPKALIRLCGTCMISLYLDSRDDRRTTQAGL